MAEWSIAAVLKTVELQGSGGSNPSLSADVRGKRQNDFCRFFAAAGFHEHAPAANGRKKHASRVHRTAKKSVILYVGGGRNNRV